MESNEDVKIVAEEVKEVASEPENVVTNEPFNEKCLENSGDSKAEPAFIVSLVSHLVNVAVSNEKDVKSEPTHVTESNAVPESTNKDVNNAVQESGEESSIVTESKNFEESEAKEEKQIEPVISDSDEIKPVVETSNNLNETIHESKPEPVIEKSELNSEPELLIAAETSGNQASKIDEPVSPVQNDNAGAEVEIQSEVIITLTKAESEIDPTDEDKLEEVEISGPEFITSLVAHRVPIVLPIETPLEDKTLDVLLTTGEIQVEENGKEISEPDGAQQVEIVLEDEIRVDDSKPEEVTETHVEANLMDELEEPTVSSNQITRDT